MKTQKIQVKQLMLTLVAFFFAIMRKRTGCYRRI